MASQVYFYDDVSRIKKGADACFKLVSGDFGGGRVSLKVHFGERGNDTFIKPAWLKGVNDFFDEPVFVDCNVLYRGSRTRRMDHLEVAREHGFGFISVDILDGELGGDSIDVPVDGGDVKVAKLGAGLSAYDKLVSVAHFKGHMACGFGGALKNIGMGLGARAGKLMMHSMASPYVREDKCVACGTCIRECPSDAIEMLHGKARIDADKCIGCVHCIAVCPEKAIDVPWNLSESVNKKLMECIADYAKAALSGRSWWFMNFVTDVTFDCDCLGFKQTPFMDDIGILLSRDPVAADQASLDLVKYRNGGVDPFNKKHGVDGTHILEYAEKHGLGTREYRLEKI